MLENSYHDCFPEFSLLLVYKQFICNDLFPTHVAIKGCLFQDFIQYTQDLRSPSPSLLWDYPARKSYNDFLNNCLPWNHPPGRRAQKRPCISSRPKVVYTIIPWLLITSLQNTGPHISFSCAFPTVPPAFNCGYSRKIFHSLRAAFRQPYLFVFPSISRTTPAASTRNRACTIVSDFGLRLIT